MLTELNEWKEKLQQFSAVKVGQTRVFLDGKCRGRECNLGSFIADAMVRTYNSVRVIFGENPYKARSRSRHSILKYLNICNLITLYLHPYLYST